MSTEGAEILDFSGYVYGGLAHSSHIRYGDAAEDIGEGSVRRGLARIGIPPEDIKGRTVMDTGTGMYGLGLNRLGAKVEHRDISSRTVEALNAYAAERSYGDVGSVRTDITQDPLPAEHFDLVFLSGVFMVFGEPRRALANIAQSLKPDGYLYLDIYRSGRWRWFVVDVLRRIADRGLLYDVLARYTDLCALAERRSFHLRQVEMLIDDLFVENLHLFHPQDVIADAEPLGLEPITEVTSMDLKDGGDLIDHSLFFAHVFNTVGFRKTGTTTGQDAAEARTIRGRDQVRELEAVGNAPDVLGLTADFLLAHESGRFSRAETVSHIVNLFRMAQPSLPGDPYCELGVLEGDGVTEAVGAEATLARRYDLWCAFLANALGVPNPREPVAMPSLGYELVRFRAD